MASIGTASVEARMSASRSLDALVRLIERHPGWTILVAAALARGATVLITTLVSAGFALDDSTYIGLASDHARGDLSGWGAHEFRLWEQTLTFMWPLAQLFKVFGAHAWIGQVYVGIWGIAAALATLAVARRFLPVNFALAAAAFVALLPSQVLWSSLVLKDAAVWALLAGLALLVARWNASVRWWLWAAPVVLLLLGMGHLRDHTFVVAAWSLPIALAFGIRRQLAPKVATGLALTIGLPVLLGLGPAGWALVADPNLAERRLANAEGARSAYIETAEAQVSLGTTDEGASETSPADDLRATADDLRAAQAGIIALETEIAAIEERVTQVTQEAAAADDEATKQRLQGEAAKLEMVSDQRREKLERERSIAETFPEPVARAPAPVVAPVVEDDLEANITHLPRGVTLMLLEPLPWRAPTSTNMLFARIETIFWYPLLVLAAAGLISVRRHLAVMVFPLLAGGGMLLAYGLAEGNIGTAYRHRGEFVWVVALLAAMGLRRALDKRRARTLEG